MSREQDDTNVDNDPALIPIQQQSAPQGSQPVVFPQAGQIHSIAGLLGPDILLSTAANTVTIAPAGNTITFSLASTVATNIFDAATEFRRGGTKVVGAREAGWTAGTGVANKGVYATYAGQTVSAGYVQAEVQAIDNAAKANAERTKAIEDALRIHGLIS